MMRSLRFTLAIVVVAVVVDIAFTSTDQALFERTLGVIVLPRAAAEAQHSAQLQDYPEHSAVRGVLSQDDPLLLPPEIAVLDTLATEPAKSAEDRSSARGHSREPTSQKSYLAYYVYAEILPEKPADIALASLKGVPVGTPLQEIKRASDAFGMNFNFMKAVAKIESDFRPTQRTGRYIGLFQLSNYEFRRYGSGEITNSRDNAMAAAFKFINDAQQFEWDTHKKPTFSELYLIHQQGWQGAAEHVKHPDWVAWKSMCATDEGKEKGEQWCKRAIWGNTLPVIKHVWKSVNNMTSRAFVSMWRQRVDALYARYSGRRAEK